MLSLFFFCYIYTKQSSKDIGNKNETLLFPHHFTDFSCKTAKFKSFELWKKNGFLWQTFFCTTSCSSFINGSKGKRCKYIYIKLKKSCIWFSTNIIDRAVWFEKKNQFFFSVWTLNEENNNLYAPCNMIILAVSTKYFCV